MIGRQGIFDACLQGLILLVIAATPLALGTVHVTAVAALQWVVLVILLTWVLRSLWVPPAYMATVAAAAPAAGGRRFHLFGHPLVSTGVGPPIALFVLLVLVQLVPVPPSLLRIASPLTARLYESSLPGWGSAEGVDLTRLGSFLLGAGHDEVVAKLLTAAGTSSIDLSPGGSNLRPISVYPFATVNRLLILMTLTALFTVVVNTFRSRSRIESLLRWIVLYGFALAIFGIVQRLSWNGKIYWTVDVEPGASPFGPFINHNHFAAFLSMIVPVATGMLMDEARRLAPRHPEGAEDAGSDGSRARRRGSAFARAFAAHGPEPFARLLLAAFIVGVMVGAMVLSASRGATLALGGALVLYGGALAVQGRIGRPEASVAAVLLLLALGLSLWLGAGPLAEKLQAISDIEAEPSLFSRVVGWQWTLKIIGDHPLLGTGLGTFSEAWARYYPPGTAAVWHEAHNDYLQLLSETGVVGIVIFAAAFAVFTWRYLLAGVLSRRRRDGYVVHGIAAGILAIALHSVVDFPLQINACAVLFVVLAGLLVAHRTLAEAPA